MGQYGRFGTILFLASAFLLISSAFSFATTIYAKTDGLDTNDGLSWDTAKKTIQAGINTAVATDEVWVAQGTYLERITLKSGVKVYGGYSGVGTTRDIALYVTTIDGNAGGTVVTSPSGATIATVIEGFTIRNGKATTSSSAGGMNCVSSSPTVAKNTFTGNNGDNSAIYLTGSPLITQNVFICNYGTTGVIVCSGGAATITRNRLIGEVGNGVLCFSSATISDNVFIGIQGRAVYAYSSATVTNNTIIGAADFGVFCDNSSPSISNNLVAFNSTGIGAVGGSPVLRNNDVYGNGTNYLYITPGTGDISLDPLLAGAEYGEVHIQPGSPCIGAGWNSAQGLPSTDFDGQARIQPTGGTVDIGADESDGTTWPAGPYVIVRVSPTGSDSNDGSSWALAKQTIQSATFRASLLGGEVWVKAGTYSERIEMLPCAYMYGGFAGAESSTSQRDWVANNSIIDGGAGGIVVTCKTPYRYGRLDGFTIRNGSGTGYGAGIYVARARVTIANNTITGNTAGYGGGICCWGSSPVIIGNRIFGNSASNYHGGGIYCTSSSRPTISNNLIVGNTAKSDGGGIYSSSSSPTIANNTISANTAAYGGGMGFAGTGTPTFTNNIVAFNSSGIYKTGTGTPVLQCNDVYGNTAYNYSGISPGTGDISLDPLLVDKDNGDYHLQFGSPCIDAGSSTSAPATDIEGCIRPQDGDGNGTALYDIGAYEYPMNLLKAKKDSTDGSTVAFGGTPVTAIFASPARIYVERSDRSQGVRIDTDKTFAEGELVNVSGTLQTDSATGERYVLPSSSYPATMSATSVLRPCAMVNRSVGGEDLGLQKGILGGVGLNNIGLLVTIWGAITEFDDPENPVSWFRVDDGSKVNVKVAVPSTVTIPKNWEYVFVTGILSCEKSGSDLLPVLKVRKQADIVPAITGG